MDYEDSDGAKEYRFIIEVEVLTTQHPEQLGDYICNMIEELNRDVNYTAIVDIENM